MPASTVSEEISHLIRDKGFPQRRAVAASLNMQRRGTLARGKKRGKKRKKGHRY